MAVIQGSARKLRDATDGAVLVEYLIALLPVLTFFLATWQLIELSTGNLILKRAASAAARAAIVVLPDDQSFYAGAPVNRFVGLRKSDVESAARSILDIAGPGRFTNVRVEISPAEPSGNVVLTTTVTADFRCFAGWVSFVCGGSSRTLSARSTHVYQGAPYQYHLKGS